MFNIITSWSNVQFNDIPYYSAFWLKNRTHFFSQYGYVWRENLYKAKKDSGRGTTANTHSRGLKVKQNGKVFSNHKRTVDTDCEWNPFVLPFKWNMVLLAKQSPSQPFLSRHASSPPPSPPLSLRTSAVLTIEFSNESPIMLPLKWNVISSVFTWWYLVFSKLSIQNEILFHSDAWRCHPLTWKEILEYLVWGTVEIPADSPGTNKQTLMPG